MKVHIGSPSMLEAKQTKCALGRELRLGKVRTEHIKRLAKELMKRYPTRFSEDFNGNKQAVNMLVTGVTPKVRNRVAGYIAHVFATVQTSNANEDIEQSE